MKRWAVCGTLGAAMIAGAGCASKPVGPYTPLDDSMRDTERAQALTHRAASAMDTDPKEAEELLREALTADLYHGPAHNNLGVLYLEQGRLYEAAGEFQWASKLLPGHPDPRMNLALTFEKAGRTDDALAEYNAAIETHPGHLPSIQGKACLQIRTGKRDEQTDALLKEIAMRGESETWRAWARLAMAKGNP